MLLGPYEAFLVMRPVANEAARGSPTAKTGFLGMSMNCEGQGKVGDGTGDGSGGSSQCCAAGAGVSTGGILTRGGRDMMTWLCLG